MTPHDRLLALGMEPGPPRGVSRKQWESHKAALRYAEDRMGEPEPIPEYEHPPLCPREWDGESE